MKPQMKYTAFFYRCIQPPYRTFYTTRDRNISPKTVHWEIDHRPWNIPQTVFRLLRKHNRGCCGSYHIPEMTESFLCWRQAALFVPLRFGPSKTYKAVILEDVEVTYNIPRKRKGAHL